MSVFIFRRSTNRHNFPICFICANMRLAYLLMGNVGKMPSLCIRVSSTRVLSSRLIGAGKQWLQASLLFNGVSWSSNLPFFQWKIKVAQTCRVAQWVLFQPPVSFEVLNRNLSVRSWMTVGFGSTCCLVELVLLNFPTPVIHWEYLSERACIFFRCPGFVVLEINTFYWLLQFCKFFEMAIDTVNSIVIFVIQKVSHRNRFEETTLFHLFRSYYWETCYVRPFFKCIWVNKELVGFVSHVCYFVLSKELGKLEVFHNFWKVRSLIYAFFLRRWCNNMI